jgi:molecular chaperone GrpE
MSDETDLTMHRARLATRLVTWLDEVLDGSAPPQGIAAEIIEKLAEESESTDRAVASTDWYGVQAALTALTQETRLQSRAFARLSEKLEEIETQKSPETESPPSETMLLLKGIEEKLDAVANLSSKHRKSELLQRDAIILLLDLRDRLLAAEHAARQALDAARAALPGWWPARWFIKRSAAVVLDGYQELLKGYLIAIERLDDTLTANDVTEFSCMGGPFDPETMKIVDIEDTDHHIEGTVLAVYRRGYSHQGTLLRAAEVKVARHKSVHDDGGVTL